MKQLFLWLVLLSFIPLDGFARRVYIDDNKSIAPQFEQKRKTTFVVFSVLNIEGSTISLPPKSTLLFSKNGKIVNGDVRFDETRIVLKSATQVFEQCSFNGCLRKGKYYISSFGVKADGKSDDAPLINSVLSLIDGKGSELIFDCDGDYGISSNDHRNTILVGSNTTVTFTGKGFLRLLSTSKLGAVLSLKKNAHDVVINNIQIDGGSDNVIVGNSGQNGVGAGKFSSFHINGGTIRNCSKGRDVTIEGKNLLGDGGKGIQIESYDCRDGFFEGIRVENCHVAISCHRNFQYEGGINVVFSNIYGKNCEQFAIIHQTNGEDRTGYEQNVLIKDFVSDNCGSADGVFIFSRARFMTIENGDIIGTKKTPAIFRGRMAKSTVRDIRVLQPCTSVIDLNPSKYGQDQRETTNNYYDLQLEGAYDYLISTDTRKIIPYRALSKSLVSVKCRENPREALYSNEVSSSGTFNLSITFLDGRIFEGNTAEYEKKYSAKIERLKEGLNLTSKTKGRKSDRPSQLTVKDKGYAFWNTTESELEIWDGDKWISYKQ